MNTTQLKLIALIAMLIDHIGQFIPGTPEYFHWIGRISAPIFVFCTSIGFYYTRDKIKYLVRLYVLSISMSLMNLFLALFFDRYYIQNNIFITLFNICLIIHLINLVIKDRSNKKYLIFYFSIHIVILFIIIALNYTNINILTLYFMKDLSTNVFLTEGGILFVSLGVIFYYCNINKISILLPYIGFSFLYSLLYSTNIVARVFLRVDGVLPDFIIWILKFIAVFFQVSIFPVYHVRFFMPINYLWMVIFALPFLLLYNGKKGRGYKYLFYVFYPLHIYILYFIQYFVFKR